ncbi:MAG: transposase, partial [Nitrospinae bacterium]|nr:transposase [Nitrospinota bacterium]
ASARKLLVRAEPAVARKECLERDLSGHDILAIFIDGKSFADNEIIIALGITLEGQKIVLGFIESSTENHRVCRDFLNGLIDRGLNPENEILFIIDGAKGLYKGINDLPRN